MKVSLRIVERFSILNSAPPKGTFKDMRTWKSIHMKTGFTEPEIQQFGIKETDRADGMGKDFSWSPEADRAVEIDYNIEEMGAIAARLKELDKLGEIKDEHFYIWEKFVQE